MSVSTLFARAREAREMAHAPYSEFAVGAAVRASSGAIYAGCNIENASYPEGWCAETAAISAMVMGGDREILEVCVVADSAAPITPCGGCRQRLAEFGRVDTVVHSASPDGVRASWTLGELLPHGFRLEERT